MNKETRTIKLAFPAEVWQLFDHTGRDSGIPFEDYLTALILKRVSELVDIVQQVLAMDNDTEGGNC